MDQLPNNRSRRRSAPSVRRFVAALAFALTALAATYAIAQATGEAPGATVATPGKEAIDQVPGRWEGLLKVAIVAAIFVGPIFIGGWLAKKLRMPDYGWKFTLGIGVIAAAAVVVSTGEIKLGPDLSGGITLIYELAESDDTAAAAPSNAEGKAQDSEGDKADKSEAESKSSPNDSQQKAGGRVSDVTVEELIAVLRKRVDPSGVKEVSIRKYGEGQIEIIIPKAEKQELEYIQDRISSSGSLVFRITASPQVRRHQPAIELAERAPAGQDIIRLGGEEVARWVECDVDEFGTVEDATRNGFVARMAGETSQILVMTDDGLDVTGDQLSSSNPGTDQSGRPQVEFTFNPKGAFLFGQLTGNHLPQTGFDYDLGIILDDRLLSAARIEGKITDRGQISGGGMTQEKVDNIVGILQAGRLPATLNKDPISRAQISPTLGAQTVEKGQIALLISLILVMLFMLWYYRAAGVIACIGLSLNMLLIVACMVLIKAAFTLPGLAGLVLTVGMSVDANVLIYERIREELKRGAALRMAIRNGFDRATTTIIDSNVTNLITGIVIYKIAPDNVKGFGVTLVLGIAMSVFVAVFLTRIVFDVAERRGWIKSLRMREFVGVTNFDFIKWRRVCIAASLVVIGIGLVAVARRDRDLFDIDFTGGSSVQFVLTEDQAMDYDAVLETLNSTPLKDKNLSLVKIGETNTHYSVTTIDEKVVEVEQILKEAFAGKLQTYEIDVSGVESVPAVSAVGNARATGGANALSGLPLPISYATLLQAAPESKETAAPSADAQPTDASKATTAPAETEPAAPPPSDQPVAPSDAAANDAIGEGSAAGADSTTDEREDEPADEDAAAATDSDDPFAGGAVSAKVIFRGSDAADAEATSGVSYETMRQMVAEAIKAQGREGVAFEVSNPAYIRGSARNFDEWTVKLALPEAEARAVLDQIQATLDNEPIFPLSNKIGGRVATRMARDALAAIVLCLAGIIGYVWFRFHGVVYGVAAVVALIHDVLVSLGFVALSAYLVLGAEPLANLLLVDKFQVSLTLVAGFLTIIGYSLNDTIVIFDRIREVKGKSPRLTASMINAAVNQTFARTLLTSFTSLISVTVLYIVGGEGIHAFAFTLLVGFIAGVYSTIYIANPVLLWLSDRVEASSGAAGSKAA